MIDIHVNRVVPLDLWSCLSAVLESGKPFLDFYAAKSHKILPSAALVPEDPTVLLTIAGMLLFKSIFLR